MKVGVGKVKATIAQINIIFVIVAMISYSVFSLMIPKRISTVLRHSYGAHGLGPSYASILSITPSAPSPSLSSPSDAVGVDTRGGGVDLMD